jgi:glutamate carboxypeptidase
MSGVPMRAWLAGARRLEPEWLALTRRLVEAESPSEDKAAVDGCMALAAEAGKGLGARVKVHRQRAYGNVLELRFGQARAVAGSADRSLVLGHLDTVWAVGTLRRMPWRVADGRVHGPGVLDMKSGVAMALTAVRMLQEAEVLTRRCGHEVVMLLVSEEEIGSPVSRAVTEAVAAECGAALVMEPAQGQALKTARKGTGSFRVEVTGRGAHSGVDFERGRSAIRELARLIEQVSEWSDGERGTTVNVGLMGGGTRTNIVPEQAWAEVDLRIARRADGPRMERRFLALKPTRMGEGCQVRVTGGINRPPMERTRGTVRLLRRAQALGAELGWSVEEAATGGASDGNFTSALGVATLDGLGPVGAGAHAAHEHAELDSIGPRTALLAGLLADRIRG